MFDVGLQEWRVYRADERIRPFDDGASSEGFSPLELQFDKSLSGVYLGIAEKRWRRLDDQRSVTDSFRRSRSQRGSRNGGAWPGEIRRQHRKATSFRLLQRHFAKYFSRRRTPAAADHVLHFDFAKVSSCAILRIFCDIYHVDLARFYQGLSPCR